ncbi:MOSC domain-containing protein [Neptunomonas qingdaonensis]|uniref:MOSC domain-containing protein YiiM n=1 Tax=Neptunomonas qingdaonensis TaxID=1045558 RepID=A0A1I2QXI7_9GAMM|nr:MOSC domain-containing protein [Neptunomonas qingdaonensis]SFG32423.1 MOSC domain-containing protein YiiM [Neptunomonas qingdaonensis]
MDSEKKQHSASVEGLYIGELSTIGPGNTATGIFKMPSDKTHQVGELGLNGDIQVDKRVHGGPEKAIYHYPAENYAVLQQALPHLSVSFQPGSIGENISTQGLLDTDVHIGDTFRLGSAIVQVSQPRRPCWKVNHKYGNAHIASVIMSEAISGWYYRVLETGQLRRGDSIELLDRLDNSIPVANVWQIFMQRLVKQAEHSTTSGHTTLAKIPGLSDEWRFE